MPYFKRSGGVTRIQRDSYGKTWYQIADQVRERDQYTCQKCFTFLGIGRGHVHHMRPLSRGGTTTLPNLILLCEECHEGKHPHMHKPAAQRGKTNKRF